NRIMPDFTISLTTAQAQRTAPALSFLNDDGSDASAAQVLAWLRRQLRGKVRQYQQQQAVAVADADVDATLAAEGW
ncbi:hypothetical protein LCGC14_2338890, partial [marine sediment metagenome]